MKSPKELFEAIVGLSKTALAEEKVKEEVVEKPTGEGEQAEASPETPEVPKAPVAPVEQPIAVSKIEFDSAIAEIKEMYTKVLESISPSQPEEVPAAISEELKEETKEEVELAEEKADEEVKEEVKLAEAKEIELAEAEELKKNDLNHNPEEQVATKEVRLYSQERVKTTEDYVFSQLFKN